MMLVEGALQDSEPWTPSAALCPWSAGALELLERRERYSFASPSTRSQPPDRGGCVQPSVSRVRVESPGGPGKWVSIYVKPFGEDAHTFIKFTPGVTPASERYWGTSGFSWFKSHGPGWIPESTFSAEYLSGFEVRHPPGL